MLAEQWQALLTEIENGEYKEDSLDLSRQDLTDDDMPDLLRALSNNTSIKHLNLSTNKIGNAGAANLAERLTLTSLDLERNAIGDAGVIALSENQSLASLNL